MTKPKRRARATEGALCCAAFHSGRKPDVFPKYIGPFNTDHKVPVSCSDFSGYFIVNVQRVTPPPRPPVVDAAS